MGVGPMMIERCDSLVETREISLHKTIRTYRPSLRTTPTQYARWRGDRGPE